MNAVTARITQGAPLAVLLSVTTHFVVSLATLTSA